MVLRRLTPPGLSPHASWPSFHLLEKLSNSLSSMSLGRRASFMFLMLIWTAQSGCVVSPETFNPNLHPCMEPVHQSVWWEEWASKTMRSMLWTKQGNVSWPHRRYDGWEILHPCLYKTKQEMFASGINKGAFWLHNVLLCLSLRLLWNHGLV